MQDCKNEGVLKEEILATVEEKQTRLRADTVEIKKTNQRKANFDKEEHKKIKLKPSPEKNVETNNFEPTITTCENEKLMLQDKGEEELVKKDDEKKDDEKKDEKKMDDEKMDDVKKDDVKMDDEKKDDEKADDEKTDFEVNLHVDEMVIEEASTTADAEKQVLLSENNDNEFIKINESVTCAQLQNFIKFVTSTNLNIIPEYSAVLRPLELIESCKSIESMLEISLSLLELIQKKRAVSNYNRFIFSMIFVLLNARINNLMKPLDFLLILLNDEETIEKQKISRRTVVSKINNYKENSGIYHDGLLSLIICSYLGISSLFFLSKDNNFRYCDFRTISLKKIQYAIRAFDEEKLQKAKILLLNAAGKKANSLKRHLDNCFGNLFNEICEIEYSKKYQ